MNGDNDSRSCYLTFIDNQKLYKLLYPLVQLANSKLEWDFDVDYLEPVQYTVYNPGDFYDWHLDEGLGSAILETIIESERLEFYCITF